MAIDGVLDPSPRSGKTSITSIFTHELGEQSPGLGLNNHELATPNHQSKKQERILVGAYPASD